MRIVFVHPNYHSGGAEIAGNWPPARVAYLAGSLKAKSFDDIHFIDAMTMHVGPDDLCARLVDLRPDIIGVTSITPSIYAAEDVLKLASDCVPSAVRVLGGVHATFMFRQVLSEAPWVDVIVRGEGEEIMVALAEAVRDCHWPADARKIKGLAFREGDKIVATQAASTVKDLASIKPDWTLIDWPHNLTSPLASAWRSRTWRGVAPSPVPSAANGSSGATTGCATRSPSPTRSRISSPTTRSASSSLPTRNPRSTRRNSSNSARN